MNHIKICDTTLRDGEQMPGVAFSKRQKIDLAGDIARFGIDMIELMPAVSETEKETAEYLVNHGFKSRITASTMSKKEHIDLAEDIGIRNITLFTSMSDIHLQKKLGTTREKNLEKSIRFIEYARELGLNVSFAGEDSTRANTSYLINFIKSLEGKIDYFLPCDTLGIFTPNQTYEMIKKIKSETSCSIGLHIHNDLGQAAANTLAGIAAGADMFSGTFNGIGERAGNAPIEEVITALKYQYNNSLPVKYEFIAEICSKVERYSGIFLQKHKPISGKNAFSHESGVHIDGILKCPENYEHFSPSSIGRKRRFLFGKHSGMKSLKYALDNGYTDKEYRTMLAEIKSTSELEKRSFSEQEIRRRYCQDV
ncbi:homoaconitate hydratase [Candidatus Woesearchaeota archaeon]|nr:homoaconitate hydratase [Candidatus Woesearchaeota archaeon]